MLRRPRSPARFFLGALVVAGHAGAVSPRDARAEPRAQTTLSVVAQPQNRELAPDAEALFQQARALHREKKWSEAREAYDRAWQIQKSFQVAANLALVELRLGRARDAAEHLAFALAHLPADDPKVQEAREHLEQMMKEATAQVGTLELTVDRRKATIYIDGSPVGSAPLGGPIYVDAGHHVLHVEPDGEPRITRDLAVQPGVRYQLSLSTAPSPATDPVPAPLAAPAPASRDEARRDPGESPTPRLAVLIGEAALTLGAAGLSTVYALQARAAERDASRLVAQINAGGDPQRVAQGAMCDPSYAARPAACEDLSAAVDDADAFSRRATVGFIVTGGLAAATVATYFLWPAPKRTSRTAILSRPRLSAAVSDKVQMVGLAGSF